MATTRGGLQIPQTKYAVAGSASIAYQVYGSGEHRILDVPGAISNVELVWEWPPAHHYFERLGTFATVAVFDKRGTGCSDRIEGSASVEERMEEIHVVMDAVGWDRATVHGLSEGGPLACLFAATYPERVERLILAGSTARFTQAPDYPIGLPRGQFDAFGDAWAAAWGTPETLTIPTMIQSQVGDEAFRQWFTRCERLSATPASLRRSHQLNGEIDVRRLLSSVRVPTLVVHARQDRAIPVSHGRYLAEHIPEARFVEYDGEHVPLLSGVDEHLDAIERFVTGTVAGGPADTVLSTVLLTDICGSTVRAAELGDAAWRKLLDRHDDALRAVLARYDGKYIKSTGDGLLATFDSPTRATRCARDLVEAARVAGVDIRVGLHTGEIERRGDDVAGIGVHVAARVAALAQPGEVLVSPSVPPLVLGSRLEFDDRGDYELKGVPGSWRLFAVAT